MCTFLVNWLGRSFWCAVAPLFSTHFLILVSHLFQLFFLYSLVRVFARVTNRNTGNQVDGLPCYFRPNHNYRVADDEPTILTQTSYQAIIQTNRAVFEPRPFKNNNEVQNNANNNDDDGDGGPP